MRKSLFGGVALGGMLGAPIEDAAAAASSNVNRASSPSKLKITDMHYVSVEHMGRACSIIRL